MKLRLNLKQTSTSVQVPPQVELHVQPKVQLKIHTIPSTSKVDLRHLISPSVTTTTNKQLVIDVLSQLIQHLEQEIKSLIGNDKKTHQFRLSSFKTALGSLKEYTGEIISGDQVLKLKLKGIGAGTAKRIDEILTTKTLSELSLSLNSGEHQNQLITDLCSVTGIGEVHARKLVEQGVTDIQDLKSKYKQGTIKLTHHMMIGLKYYDDFREPIPFREIAELGAQMKQCVASFEPQMIVEICGSHRRQKAFSGDIDVLMTHPSIVTDEDLIKCDTSFLVGVVKELKKIHFLIDDLTSQGDTKYMGVCCHPQIGKGRRIDIRFVTYDSFYPALVYFTGSMPLNKAMRTVALQKGYTLNEYGLFKLVNGEKGDRIVTHSEEQLFDLLNLVYLKPHERELI
jgi:DNA polymerase/3'-5' exonuclease PolX